ncbi:MAG: HEAT repeat domain-containing protein [Planctomycetes bacterium]|nr:HEAT repeat domain-containing protein [Planctomycetota bacterium]
MSEPTDPEFELRKKIAETATSEDARPSIFIQATQFFVVPLGIVLVCVGVYLFFSYLVSEERQPQDLVERLRTGGAVARRHAAHQLVAEVRRQSAARRPDPALVEPILSVLKALPKEDLDVRQLLTLCLGALGDRRAVEPILEELRGTADPATRAACIEALGALRAPETADPLIQLLDDPSTVVRKYAAFNLAAVAAPDRKGEAPAVSEAIPHLRRKLEDPRPEVRWNAATGLAFFLGDSAGAPVLLQMLDRTYVEGIVQDDPEHDALASDVVAKACQAIGALGDRDLKDALRAPSERDPDPQVRHAARRAMDALK